MGDVCRQTGWVYRGIGAAGEAVIIPMTLIGLHMVRDSNRIGRSRCHSPPVPEA